MSKLFFDHLVIREEIDIYLDSCRISDEEKAELVQIIDQTLINHILNVILNHLPKNKHAHFVAEFHAAPHDTGHLDYLRLHAHPEIEAEIKRHAQKIKQEILGEISKVISKPKKSSRH